VDTGGVQESGLKVRRVRASPQDVKAGSAIIRDIAYRYVIATESISYRRIDISIDSI